MIIKFEMPKRFAVSGDCGGCASHSCGGGR